MNDNRSIAFFNEQFRRQRDGAALELNAFEALALPYLRGDVLDFGCGLGNLAFAAAGRGCQVTALDASTAAIEHIRERVAREGASVSASRADLRDHPIDRDYDCIACIGLLMFFDCPTAFEVLARLQSHVRAGGIAAVNVLVEGTSYLDMFEPGAHCLFGASQLQARFAGWHIEQDQISQFDAPHHTVKRFVTVVARKPDAGMATA